MNFMESSDKSQLDFFVVEFLCVLKFIGLIYF